MFSILMRETVPRSMAQSSAWPGLEGVDVDARQVAVADDDHRVADATP